MGVLKKRPAVVPAVHANAGVQAWYRGQLETIVNEAHDELVRLLRAVFATTEPAAIGFAQDADRITALERAMAKWATKWQSSFNRMSLNLAARFSGRAQRATEQSMAAAFKRAGFTIEFRPTRASVQAYKAVAAENVGLIKSIPSQYLTDVQSQVWASVKAGADMSTLASSLRESYGVATRRAQLIARDQNNKAKAVIENVRRQQLGIREAIWQHSHAGKVPRPTHVKMNGNTYDLDKGMYDPHEKKYVYPGQLVNCRCTSRAIIPGYSA